MKRPDELGVDVDGGVVDLCTVLSIMKTLGITGTVFITRFMDERSHFHVETNHPTSIVLRKFLGDDEGRISWALARTCWNGRPPDYLSEWKSGRGERKKISIRTT